MMPIAQGEQRVLAVHPVSRGFGWAVLEGPKRLIEWGVKHARGSKFALQGLAELLDYFDPHLIVMEDTAAPGSRRCQRVREMLARMQRVASARRTRSRRVSRREVREVFAQFGATTKHQIALAIAKRFPELDPRLPPLRKPWMSEDDRMSIFDAVAFALTAYNSETSREKPTPPNEGR